MSLKSRESRKALALAGLTAVAAFGATATSAQANFQKTLTYSCVYPLVGAQPLRIEIDAAIPATVKAKTATGVFKINAVAVAGGDTSSAIAIIGASTIEGAAPAKATVKAPGITLPVTVPITVPKQAVASSGDLILNASGNTPSLQFPTAGPASITVDAISLNLKAVDADGVAALLDPVPGTVDSDGNPETFDAACKLAPTTQDTTLANITITDGDVIPNPTDTQAPTAPGKPTATGVTSSTADLSWAASSDNTGVTGYDIYNGATKISSSGGASATLTGLAANTTYSVTVKAKDAAGNASGASQAVSFKTLVASTDPGTGTVVPYNYSAKGTATLKTLIKGSLPLTGSINAKLQLPSGNFTADLNLNPSSAPLTALGFLPVVAKVNIKSTAPVTGTLVNGKMTAIAKVRIYLPSVTLLGIPLGGGGTCQTKQISVITLHSIDTFFKPLVGGGLAGSLSISDLNGCGFLNGIISPLTAGKGNAIALMLTPAAV